MTGTTAEPLLFGRTIRDRAGQAGRRLGGCRAGGAGPDRAAAAEGTPNVEIARLVGVSRPTVNAWRTRYAERGLPGLADEQRSGRKQSRSISDGSWPRR